MYVTYDDFNDNSFDTNKWVYYKVTDIELYERNQRLEFVWTGGTGGAGNNVKSTKVFDLRADKEYEISVTVIECGMGASLIALVNEKNYYSIGLSREGELGVSVVVDGNYYPLKSMVVEKTSGRLTIGVSNSEVYFKFDGDEVYRETYRLPSRSVNIMLNCMVSNTEPLAAFDDVGYTIATEAQIMQTILSLIPFFILMIILTMFSSLVRTLMK